MKRIISLLIIACIFSVVPHTVFAKSSEQTVEEDSQPAITNTQTYTTYFEDGSYEITTITTETTAILDGSSKATTKATSGTAKGSKVTEHYNDNTLLWKVTLSGVFTYTGTSATCTNASHSISIYNSAWYTYSQNSYKSGRKAVADVVMKKKLLGIVTSTRNVHLEISCDNNGNLS